MENSANRSNVMEKLILSDILTSDMTNGAAIGYMIMAAQSLELDNDTIRALESCMKEKMDFYSEEQAEQRYRTFA